MTKYVPVAGFTGSEIERASLIGGVYPMETAFQRKLKQQVANSLIRLANYLAPSNITGFETRNMRENCC